MTIPAPLELREWLEQRGVPVQPPGFTFINIKFELLGKPSARLTSAFRRYVRGLDPERDAEDLVWYSLTEMSRVKWRYLLRDDLVNTADLHKICDVVVGELLKVGCVNFPEPEEDALTRAVRFRRATYDHWLTVEIARLPADKVLRREHDDWIFNSKSLNPEYNPLAIDPRAASTGRSHRPKLVPWVEDPYP